VPSATKTTSARRPAKKAAPAKRAAPRVIDGTAQVAPLPIGSGEELPTELRDFYAPPKLSKARGAGTTGPVDTDDLDFDTSVPDAEMPMERLFSIDGVAYFIPVEFPVGYSMIYLDALDEGRDIAVGRVLKLAVGKGWTALVDLARERPQLITPAHLARIMDIVLNKIMGTIEEAGEGK